MAEVHLLSLTGGQMIAHSSWRRVSFRLLLLHLAAIAITLVSLAYQGLAALIPFIYPVILLITGLAAGLRKSFTPGQSLLAGILGQAPGLICSALIIPGLLRKLATPDVFDFLLQLWQTPFTPLYPMLPQWQILGTPLYYWISAWLPFVIPLIPAAGTCLGFHLNQKVRN